LLGSETPQAAGQASDGCVRMEKITGEIKPKMNPSDRKINTKNRI
jgi:hypothetical protein